MHTILVPTDFSKISRNALNYAIEIAKLTKAKIILFHVYQIPVIATDVVIVPSLVEIEEGCLAGLKKLQSSMEADHGKKITMESVCRSGFPIDEINLFAKKNKVDLIVMGMHGSGYLGEKLIGSVTTSLIRKATCPVLVIDRRVKFSPIKKIALACDYQGISNNKILAPLKEFVRLFKGEIYVINILPEIQQIPAISKAIAGIQLEHALEDVKHSFYFAENKNVVNGLNNFVKKEKIGMITMIPKKHSLLKRIFNEPKTTRIAFHTNVPVLALHE